MGKRKRGRPSGAVSYGLFVPVPRTWILLVKRESSPQVFGLCIFRLGGRRRKKQRRKERKSYGKIRIDGLCLAVAESDEFSRTIQV